MGGRNRQNFVTSVYLLDLCTLAWTNIDLQHAENPAAKICLERAEFSCAGSRFEDRIYIFGGVDSSFALTNEVLELHFDQLRVNPLLANQYRSVKSSKQQGASEDVALQFFNLRDDDSVFANEYQLKPQKIQTSSLKSMRFGK